MSVPSLPAVLFDLDGTLIDSIELILSSARYAFTSLERTCPSDSEWLTGVGIPLPTMFRRYARDEADLEVLIRAYREYQMANHDRLVRCYDSVVEALNQLQQRGHQIGVVTSKSDALAMRGLATAGILGFMDVIVGYDSCARHKPDPEPVRLALERLGREPHEAVFVGDSVHDMEAGNAAGVLTIAALWGPFDRETLEASNPGHYLETISGLPDLLGELRGFRGLGVLGRRRRN
jgi:pyrophosphatase PpaX